MRPKRYYIGFLTLVISIILIGSCGGAAHSEEGADSIQSSEQPKPPVQQTPSSRRLWMVGLNVVPELDVTPLSYSGECPARFTLSGRISSNKPVLVYYRFIAFGKLPAAPQRLTFEAAGTKQVEETIFLGDKSSREFSSSMILQITWPMEANSKEVPVKGVCTSYAQAPASGLPGVAQQPMPGPGPGIGPGAIGVPPMGPMPQSGPSGPSPMGKTLPGPGVQKSLPGSPSVPQPSQPLPGNAPAVGPGPSLPLPSGPAVPQPSQPGP